MNERFSTCDFSMRTDAREICRFTLETYTGEPFQLAMRNCRIDFAYIYENTGRLSSG